MRVILRILLLGAFAVSLIEPAYACPSCLMSVIGNLFLTAFIPVIIVFPLLLLLISKISEKYYHMLREFIFVLASLSFVIIYAAAYYFQYTDMRMIPIPIIGHIEEAMFILSKPGYGDGGSSILLMIMVFYLFRIKVLWDDFSYARFALSFLIFLIAISSAWILFILVSFRSGSQAWILGVILLVSFILAIMRNKGELFHKTCKTLAYIGVISLISGTLSMFVVMPLFLSRQILEMKPLTLKDIISGSDRNPAADSNELLENCEKNA